MNPPAPANNNARRIKEPAKMEENGTEAKEEEEAEEEEEEEEEEDGDEVEEEVKSLIIAFCGQISQWGDSLLLQFKFQSR